jgi:hypothetical protein
LFSLRDCNFDHNLTAILDKNLDLCIVFLAIVYWSSPNSACLFVCWSCTTCKSLVDNSMFVDQYQCATCYLVTNFSL